MRGSAKIEISNSASQNIKWAKKSPYFRKKIEHGAIIQESDIAMKRPFNGQGYDDIRHVVGKEAKRIFEKDELINPKEFT